MLTSSQHIQIQINETQLNRFKVGTFLCGQQNKMQHGERYANILFAERKYFKIQNEMV